MSTRLDHITLSASASTTAGHTFPITLTAWDPYGNIDTGYTGTLTFVSSDPRATLPASYTFTAADNATHAFAAALRPSGAQSITATDTAPGIPRPPARTSATPAPPNPPPT